MDFMLFEIALDIQNELLNLTNVKQVTPSGLTDYAFKDLHNLWIKDYYYYTAYKQRLNNLDSPLDIPVFIQSYMSIPEQGMSALSSQAEMNKLITYYMNSKTEHLDAFTRSKLHEIESFTLDGYVKKWLWFSFGFFISFLIFLLIYAVFYNYKNLDMKSKIFFISTILLGINGFLFVYFCVAIFILFLLFDFNRGWTVGLTFSSQFSEIWSPTGEYFVGNIDVENVEYDTYEAEILENLPLQEYYFGFAAFFLFYTAFVLFFNLKYSIFDPDEDDQPELDFVDLTVGFFQLIAFLFGLLFFFLLRPFFMLMLSFNNGFIYFFNVFRYFDVNTFYQQETEKPNIFYESSKLEGMTQDRQVVRYGTNASADSQDGGLFFSMLNLGLEVFYHKGQVATYEQFHFIINGFMRWIRDLIYAILLPIFYDSTNLHGYTRTLQDYIVPSVYNYGLSDYKHIIKLVGFTEPLPAQIQYPKVVPRSYEDFWRFFGHSWLFNKKTRHTINQLEESMSYLRSTKKAFGDFIVDISKGLPVSPGTPYINSPAKWFYDPSVFEDITDYQVVGQLLREKRFKILKKFTRESLLDRIALERMRKIYLRKKEFSGFPGWANNDEFYTSNTARQVLMKKKGKGYNARYNGIDLMQESSRAYNRRLKANILNDMVSEPIVNFKALEYTVSKKRNKYFVTRNIKKFKQPLYLKLYNPKKGVRMELLQSDAVKRLQAIPAARVKLDQRYKQNILDVAQGKAVNFDIVFKRRTNRITILDKYFMTLANRYRKQVYKARLLLKRGGAVSLKERANAERILMRGYEGSGDSLSYREGITTRRKRARLQHQMGPNESVSSFNLVSMAAGQNLDSMNYPYLIFYDFYKYGREYDLSALTDNLEWRTTIKKLRKLNLYFPYNLVLSESLFYRPDGNSNALLQKFTRKRKYAVQDAVYKLGDDGKWKVVTQYNDNNIKDDVFENVIMKDAIQTRVSAVLESQLADNYSEHSLYKVLCKTRKIRRDIAKQKTYEELRAYYAENNQYLLMEMDSREKMLKYMLDINQSPSKKDFWRNK